MTELSNTKYFDRLMAIKNNPTKKLAVLGLGVENWQFVSWAILIFGIKASQLILIDQRENLVIPPQYSNLSQISSSTYVGGTDYLKWFLTQKADLVVKAPGIWSLKNELNTYRDINGQDSIISSLTFFVERFRSSIIGITGTKGKTTTCSLTTHLLKDSGLNKQIEYCGNTTNISPYQFWTNINDNLENYIFVMELSSFQLQDLGFTKLSPKFAGITNYYIDHLDQHSNELEYHQAKNNIFKWQIQGDTIVLPTNIREKQFLSDQDRNRDLLVGQKSHTYAILSPSQDTIYKTNLKGNHNQTNIQTAVLLVGRVFQLYNLNLDLSPEFIREKLNNFEPPKGRLELIKTLIIDGVNFCFYNDNTATEPDAVCACIDALTQNSDMLIIILAGKVKQGNYPKLIEALQTKKSSILQIKYCGQVGAKLQEMQNLPIINTPLKSLLSQNWNYRDLIQDYKLQADSNVNIVLSPGGSSFDEFVNYIERGQLYLDWIAKQN